MPDDISDGIATTGRVTVGNSLTGEIETTSDSDAYAVELVAGRTYRIDLEGAATGKGTLADPFLRWLRDSSGDGLHGTRDYDGGEGLNPRQVFTPQWSGTYYITASGQGDSVGTYTLTVTDTSQQQVVQQAPAFGQESYAFTLAENADGALFGIAVGSVSAVDPDGAPVTYSIEAGDRDGLFMIDAETGLVVYLGTGEDYESGTTSYELTVRASDGSLHSDATVTVDVTDVEEYAVLEQTANEAPAFAYASYAFGLAENADGGTNRVSLGTVAATDPDDDAVAYSIEGGNASGLFEIDAASGELFYVGAGEDYEAGTARFDLTIRASDGQLTADTTVTVNVTDVAEAPAFGQQDYTFELAENAGGAVPVSLGLVTATDPENGPITYSIEGGDPDGLFAIDPATGALSYRGAGEDYESGTTSYELTVRASDGGLHTGVTVTVNVTDVADEEEYVSLQQQASVSEPDGQDLPANTSTTGVVAVGGSATGEIFWGDRDWFAVELEANKAYRIDLEGWWTGHGTLRDPYLRGIYDADGVRIPGTTNDDGGAGSNSREYLTTTEAGTYYLAAGAWGGGEGTYKLSVVEVVDDFGVGTGTTGTVAVGGSATGEIIDYADDRDWFAVELEAGKTYRIDLKGAWTGDGTLYDPYLRGIHDMDGVLISGTRGDNGGVGRQSRVTFTATADGTYYVAAGAAHPHGSNDFQEGTYTLFVTDITNGIPDDYAAGTGTSGAVAVGSSATGEIEFRDDRDWFAVELEAGKTYRIDLEGYWTGDDTLCDPYLRGIYDADGDRFAGTTNDDGGTERNSRVYFTAAENATYYVAAGGDYYWEGTYTLSVTEAVDDLAAGTGTSGAVAVGGSATGEIDFWGDRDWFAVELEADKIYRIDLRRSGSEYDRLHDPYLRGVHDADGNFIAGTTNDDVGRSPNSRVYFTAEDAGTYYVAAGGYGKTDGTYTLSVRDVTDTITDDYEAGTETTGVVAVGGSARGEIEMGGDHDWFAVQLAAGKSYAVDIEAHSTRSGSLGDPYLRGIHDADGNRIAYTANDDGGWGTDSRVTFTAEDAGTYYVAASAQGAGEGTYKLSVAEYQDDFAAGTGTRGVVAVGGSATGEIDVWGDRDWFAVDLEAGTTYRFNMEGLGDWRVRLSNPWLRGIHDADGVLIADTANKPGFYQNERVTFTAEADGTHYVAASSDINGVGAYTLSVEEVM